MITRIREVRRARKLTLQEVADRCNPPTTPQTIGRLETGTRTVSVGWLNRIADALGVGASDLVQLPEREDVPVAAILGSAGVNAPRKERVIVPPHPQPGQVAVLVEAGIGDYRAGDELWLERLAPEAFARANDSRLVFTSFEIGAISASNVDTMPFAFEPTTAPSSVIE